MIVSVNIFLKRGVLDPEAQTIEQTLKTLGFKDFDKLQRSKTISFEFSHNNKQKAIEECTKMAQELLVNHVIEDFSIDCRED